MHCFFFLWYVCMDLDLSSHFFLQQSLAKSKLLIYYFITIKIEREEYVWSWFLLEGKTCWKCWRGSSHVWICVQLVIFRLIFYFFSSHISYFLFSFFSSYFSLPSLPKSSIFLFFSNWFLKTTPYNRLTQQKRKCS